MIVINDTVAIAKRIRAAMDQGDAESMANLIRANDALRLMTPFGTWLHIAASSGNLKMVQALIELGAEVNARGGTFDGNALNVAASNGHLEVVEYLLSLGAEMDVNEPERNPLFAAIYGGHVDVVRLLLAHGIDPTVTYNGPNMKDMDAFAFATERGQREIADVLKGTRRAH